MSSFEASTVSANIEDAVRLATRHKLYGRSPAVGELLEALARINRGNGEVLLVPGVSGTGKTALAQVLKEPASALNGFFLEGKFNQYDQNVPYVAWRQALAGFCELIAQEDEAEVEVWKARILEAVGGNGQLLVDLVPEFGNLLGKQAPVAAINPLEARHRFAGVIRSLLEVICRPEHPLVLFIDDWQWADAASLHLLTQLQIGSTLRYLLIIAAYRSDEVDKRHPWITTLADLRSQAVVINTSEVRNLGIDEVQMLVAEALAEFGEPPQHLARSIHATSQGNPFFAHTLVGMYRENGIVGDGELTASTIAEQFTLPDDVVDVFTHRIARLEPACQELLSLAACLGNRFELDALAMISGRNSEECESLLLNAASDLVTPLDAGRNTGTVQKDSRRWFQFLHDRVQQAAYLRIPNQEMSAIRLEIARKMLERLDADQLSDQVCEVAEHFNAGASLIEQPDEWLRGVELNVNAARKALAATAFGAALRYHRAARACLNTPGLDDELWSNQHELAMDLFREQAETEFLEGDRAEAEHCVRLAVAHSQTAIQKSETLSILIVQHTLQSRYADAIATGREALMELGIALPEENYEAARDAEIAAAHRNLQGRSMSDLSEMPVATDETMRVAAKLLITMGPPCYRAHQQLWSVIVPRVVNLTLRYGHIPEIGYSHTAFAGLLGWVSNDYATGRAYSEFATQLMADSLASPSDKSVFHLMIGSSVRHWFSHLVHSSEDYTAAYQIGQQSGNLQYAAYAFGHNMYCRFYQGIPLDTLIRESQSALAFSRTRHNQWAIDLLEGGLHIFNELSATESDKTSDTDWEPNYLHRLESHQNQQVGCIYKIIRANQCLVMGQHERALKLTEEAQTLIYTVGTQGLLPWAEHVFAKLLAITGLYENANEDQQSLWRLELDRLIGQLQVWAEHCPDNFEHKYLLATAEMAMISGEETDAVELYDQAVEAAHAGHFCQWEGLANERASRFWKRNGNGRFEQIYWQQAYQCYDRWGATAKLDAMVAEYRRMLATSVYLGASAVSTQGGKSDAACRRLLNRHIQILQTQTREVANAREQMTAAMKAEELAAAADSLRANITERRRTTVELRRQRDAQQELNEELERRVKERTAEISRAEARFRTVLESAPIAMVMIDAEGKIVLVNARTEETFGYDRQELLGEPVEVLLPELLRDSHVHTRKGFLEKPTARVMGEGRDLFGARKDGSEFPVEIGLNPVETAEGTLVLAAIADITERSRLIQRLKQSNVELEEFAYVASHDLQEPLRKISSYAELLREDCGEHISDAGHKYLNVLIDGSQRLKQLVCDLLLYSRIATHGKELQVVDANACLQAAVDGLELAIRENGAHITSDRLPVVTADASQLTMLFQNLISNAIKYRSEVKPEIHIGSQEMERSHEFFVRDNGIGIEPRYFDRIFEIFKRLHARHEYGGGTGIGLANCKRIVDRFGGRIWVDSTPGEGSTFYFTIKKTDE